MYCKWRKVDRHPYRRFDYGAQERSYAQLGGTLRRLTLQANLNISGGIWPCDVTSKVFCELIPCFRPAFCRPVASQCSVILALQASLRQQVDAC